MEDETAEATWEWWALEDIIALIELGNATQANQSIERQAA